MVYAGHSSQVLEHKLRVAGWVFGTALNLQVFSVRGLGFRGATRPKPKDPRPIGRFVQTSQKIIWNHAFRALNVRSQFSMGPKNPKPKTLWGPKIKWEHSGRAWNGFRVKGLGFRV